MTSSMCAICGNEKLAYGNWFLVVENPSQERLRITHWDHRLAGSCSISHACSAAHVREIFAQWITLGRLPSTSTNTLGFSSRKQNENVNAHVWDVAGQSQPIGELALHRLSMPERPEMLKSILDAVFCLVQNASYCKNDFFEESQFHPPILQEMVPMARSASV